MRMKEIKIFIVFAFLAFISCSTNRKFTTIYYKNIESSSDKDVITNSYHKQLMRGVFKIKYKTFGEYCIAEFKDGKYNGLIRYFEKGELIEEENYLEGKRQGERILYKDDRKREIYNYIDGFPYGEKLIVKDGIIDSSQSIVYDSDNMHMNIYVNDKAEVQKYQHWNIYSLVEPCSIKADKYVQKYLLKSDSTLLYQSTWYRVNDCFHKNKEWGHQGIEY